MPIAPVRWLQNAWAIGRQFETIIEFNERTQRAIDRLETGLRDVEDRLLILETGQAQTIVEAKSAAAAAATTMAAGALFEAATRIAQLEMRVSNLVERPYLSPPADKP